MEQLHSVTVSGAVGADNFTAPQWQAASIIVFSLTAMGNERRLTVQPGYLGTRRGFLQH
jgi:hypothetical protein